MVLLHPKVEADAGLSPSEALALTIWVEDHLALVAGTTVVRTRELPASSEWQPGRDGLVVRLVPRRVGEALRLDLDRARAHDLRAGGSLQRVSGPPQAPLEAVTAACRAILPRSWRDSAGRLIPASSQGFWDLLRIRGRVVAQGLGSEDEAGLWKLAEVHPDCATPWVVLGEGLALRGLTDGPPSWIASIAPTRLWSRPWPGRPTIPGPYSTWCSSR